MISISDKPSIVRSVDIFAGSYGVEGCYCLVFSLSIFSQTPVDLQMPVPSHEDHDEILIKSLDYPYFFQNLLSLIDGPMQHPRPPSGFGSPLKLTGKNEVTLKDGNRLHQVLPAGYIRTPPTAVLYKPEDPELLFLPGISVTTEFDDPVHVDYYVQTVPAEDSTWFQDEQWEVSRREPCVGVNMEASEGVVDPDRAVLRLPLKAKPTTDRMLEIEPPMGFKP